MSVKLKKLYLSHEKKTIQKLSKKIVAKLREQGKAYYFQKDGSIVADRYLEIEKIWEGDKIFFKNKNNKPKENIVSFAKLEDAIKFTLRKGKIANATEYLHMGGTSNYIGTPLHLLVKMIDEKEYKQNSLVGRELNHQVFGGLQIKNVDFTKDMITTEIGSKEKSIMMDYWDLNEEDEFLPDNE